MKGDSWRNDLVEAFERFDADNNNLIDRGEFDALLTALGSEMVERDRDLGFAMIDKNVDGAISLEELAEWWEVVRTEGTA
jgi:Ca2+-binding EF-hand superfamily protein